MFILTSDMERSSEIMTEKNTFDDDVTDDVTARRHIAALVVNYGISNTLVLEIP